jgi:probable rRNA maturation factor
MTRTAKRAPEAATPAARPGPRPTRPTLSLSLQLADGRHRSVLTRSRVGRWIRAALDVPAEMTVRVVDEDEGRSLNQAWRGKDGPTNVLTFAYEDGANVHADLVLCAPVVEREAEAQGRSLEAHYAHLLVHGTLHAQGLDHEDDAEASAMEARETAVLASLGFADPYAG